MLENDNIEHKADCSECKNIEHCPYKSYDNCYAFVSNNHTCADCHYYGDNGWCYYCEDITFADEPACKVWEPRVKL